MIIPNAEQIEGAIDAIFSDPASASDLVRCTRELRVGNPPLLHRLTGAELSLAANAFFLGLKTAKYMVESGSKL